MAVIGRPLNANVRAQCIDGWHMAEWIVLAVVTLFTAWVVFLGGAERLEGTIKSAFLISAAAPSWHAAGIKAYVAISWVGAVIWLLLF